MVRHVVMFRWKPDTPQAAKRAVQEGLARLPAAIPEIRRYEFGRDLALADGNFDFAVVADFADADAYRRYASHEAHQAVIAERIRPHVAERSAVQYALGDSA